MSVWDELQRMPGAGRFSLQNFVALRAAALLGTHLGPDYDVIIDGRLVSVAAYVPMFSPRDPPTDERIWAAVESAAQRFVTENGRVRSSLTIASLPFIFRPVKDE
jgi:hypothetical protein